MIVELSLIICYVTSPNSLGSLSHQDLSVHSHGGCFVRCWEVLDHSICLMMLGSHQKVISLTCQTKSRVQGYGLIDLISISSNSLSNHFSKMVKILDVRTYVIYFLGTYVTILCNWLIFWQNALYLYLGRSKMCLIFQETLFQDQVLKTCKSVQETS